MGRRGPLDRHLEGREYIAGTYSIADIAAYPWIVPHASHGQDLKDFPNLARWFESIHARPATQRTYVGIKDPYAPSSQPVSDEERRVLFGQNARK